MLTYFMVFFLFFFFLSENQLLKKKNPENDIDGEQLLELNQDHLKELGVPSLGKRMKLLKHVSYLPNASLILFILFLFG